MFPPPSDRWLLVGAWFWGSRAHCSRVCCLAAAQFLSRVIPFLYNGWFVRQLSADDCAVRISPAPPISLFLPSSVQ
jgi:hypothetical protein